MDTGKTGTAHNSTVKIRQASARSKKCSVRSPERYQGQAEQMVKVWNITPGRSSETECDLCRGQLLALHIERSRRDVDAERAIFDIHNAANLIQGQAACAPQSCLTHKSDRIYIAIFAGGCYRTDDGGQTWTPHNKGVRANYQSGPIS